MTPPRGWSHLTTRGRKVSTPASTAEDAGPNPAASTMWGMMPPKKPAVVAKLSTKRCCSDPDHSVWYVLKNDKELLAVRHSESSAKATARLLSGPRDYMDR